MPREIDLSTTVEVIFMGYERLSEELQQSMIDEDNDKRVAAHMALLLAITTPVYKRPLKRKIWSRVMGTHTIEAQENDPRFQFRSWTEQQILCQDIWEGDSHIKRIMYVWDGERKNGDTCGLCGDLVPFDRGYPTLWMSKNPDHYADKKSNPRCKKLICMECLHIIRYGGKRKDCKDAFKARKKAMREYEWAQRNGVTAAPWHNSEHISLETRKGDFVMYYRESDGHWTLVDRRQIFEEMPWSGDAPTKEQAIAAVCVILAKNNLV